MKDKRGIEYEVIENDDGTVSIYSPEGKYEHAEVSGNARFDLLNGSVVYPLDVDEWDISRKGR